MSGATRLPEGKPPQGRERRQVATLVRHALAASDQGRRWKDVVALHRRGTRDVLDAATALCAARSVKERQLGADILGQLGVPDRTFPREALDILQRMIRTEKSPAVLNSALVAMSHTQEIEDRRGLRDVVRLGRHRDARVRFGSLMALAGRSDAASIGALIRLTTDRDQEVRDWATFGLGTQVDVDTPRVRKALLARVGDRHADTRSEAILGLARRRTPEICSILIEELEREAPESLVFEAVALLGDTSLREHLEGHLRRAKQESGVDPSWLESLTEALDRLAVPATRRRRSSGHPPSR